MRKMMYIAPILAAISSAAPAYIQHHAGHARAELLDSSGPIKGKAMIMQGDNGLRVTLQASGLTPGEHAVHLHMIGSCTAPDFMSAGGHWNPMQRQHGKDNPAGAHFGDLPNMLVAADGTGSLDAVVAQAKLSGDDAALLDTDGAAVVIHAGPDDYKTDPTGAAGGRIACGIVQDH